MQLNKTLLSSYEFNGYLTLLVTQLILSIIFCVVSREYFGDPFKIPKMDLELVYKCVGRSILLLNRPFLLAAFLRIRMHAWHRKRGNEATSAFGMVSR